MPPGTCGDEPVQVDQDRRRPRTVTCDLEHDGRRIFAEAVDVVGEAVDAVRDLG